MTQNEKAWFNLFLAVEDLEKIKKSFENKTVSELQNKIINLHTELNKKVAKIKNQKEENTLLLKQKEELKKEISYKQNKDNGIIELLKQGQVALDDLNKTIDLLEDRIKEKDTIIKYL